MSCQKKDVSRNFRLSFVIALLCLVMGIQSAWADSEECQQAKSALAIAEADLKEMQRNLKNAKEYLKEKKANLEEKKEAHAKLKQAHADAVKESRDNYQNFREQTDGMNLMVFDMEFNTKDFQKYSALEDKWLDANGRAFELEHELASATGSLRAAHIDADNAASGIKFSQRSVYYQEDRVDRAKDKVKKACASGLEDFISLLEDDTKKTIRGYKNLARDANQEDIAIEEDRKRGGTSSSSSSSSSSGTSTISINANCDVNSGSGTSTLSLNGSSFCSVTGAAPTFASGSKTITCNSGSTVTLSLSCTATNCRLNQTSLTPAGFSFTGINNGINGPFTGVTSFTGTCP